MKRRIRFPLMAKMLVWLCVHLAVLASAFAVFVAWQLRLGLDSLLSGAAGERLRALGEEIASDLRGSPRRDWAGIIAARETESGVRLYLQLAPGEWIGPAPGPVPENVERRIKERRRPQRLPPRGPGGPPVDRPPPSRADPLRSEEDRPRVRPDFLLRGANGDGYWAGIDLPLFEPRRQAQPLHGLLLVRADDLSGSGLFFDLKPWILGGLGVLALSLLLWAPVFLGITRYIRRLSRATEAIADGNFDARVGAARSDELGHLGSSIEEMASRLHRHVHGQKRFLGDVAHELCSPLARIRTGLGVLEHGLSPEQTRRLESIDEDVGELSQLVEELLTFTKASTAPDAVRLEEVELLPVIHQAAARESAGQPLRMDVAPALMAKVDRALIGRVIANVLRNARQHAGSEAAVSIRATREGGQIILRIADNGRGVADEDLPRLFEPFFRPDAARTREAGGTGLGLAIVRSGVQACGGEVHAEHARPSGLAVVIRLPAA
jgi:two-component system sensor histidine kinase CpxA